MDVDVAGISVKVRAHYPGRSVLNNGQKSAEGIVTPVAVLRQQDTGTKA